MWPPLLNAISPAGERARLSTLIFHRVLPAPDPLLPWEVDVATFDHICSWVSQWFNVLPLDDAVDRLAQGRLPARAMTITFDDGYEDNHRHALPILKRHGLMATFFVATGFLDGGRMWNDSFIESIRRATDPVIDLRSAAGDLLGRFPVGSAATRRAAIDAVLALTKYLPLDDRVALSLRFAEELGVDLPDDLMMRSEQVLALRRAGMQIGAHTVSHPILARLDVDSARREIEQSKETLENLLGEPVTLFAYPNGRSGTDYDDQSVSLVRDAGFKAAVSTDRGVGTSDSDLFQLPRFTPWDRSKLRFGFRLVDNLRRAA
ncbi:MAG: polysaccharide deacetylase family protein [Burkholderiaceae bacterium]|nr:polysaccharide deacetylase family protein [Burkholderiaceae bacterium]